MYTAFLTTNRGAEEVASKESSELISCSNHTLSETVVKFDFEKLIDLCKIAYMSQAANRVALLFFEFKAEKSLEESATNFLKHAEKTDFSKWFSKEKTFKIDCTRIGEHDFHSVDIEAQAGQALCKIIEKKQGFDPKTDFVFPSLRLFLYIFGEKGYFGIDFSGFELSKRQYKIFNHPESLKGTTGYALVKLAGYDKKKVLLDPFMGSGVILIEAALYAAGFPVQYYNKDKLAFTSFDFFNEFGKDKFFNSIDKKIKEKKTDIMGYDSQLRFLKASQKNAKLAGIEKNLHLSRSEIEWLDTKIDKGTVELIVTDPPRDSKNKEEKKIEKVYNEFFYQADYILKKKGMILLITRDYALLEKAAGNHKFKITSKYTLNQGKEIFNVLSFARD